MIKNNLVHFHEVTHGIRKVSDSSYTIFLQQFFFIIISIFTHQLQTIIHHNSSKKMYLYNCYSLLLHFALFFILPLISGDTSL